MRVAFLILDDAEELDWVGPWEVPAALHLVARLHSMERSKQVRRYFQNDPEPPA